MKKFNLLKGLAMSLLTLALCFVAFGAVKAKADTLEGRYNAETDTIIVSSDSGGTVYYVDLGKSGAQKVKTNNIKTLSLSGSNNAFSGEIVLDNKDDGLKIGEKKAIYLYISKSDPSADTDSSGKVKTKSANVTVKGSTAAKFTVTLNYACAQSGDKTKIAFTAADKAGKAIAQDNFIFRFSEDGKNFGDWKPSTEFTAHELYNAIANGEGKYTYQFKLKKAGERDSAPVKVKVAKEAKAPKIKIDFLKGTAAIKNGFDYYVSSSSAKPTSLSGWITILPTNKAGTAEKGAIYKATSSVVPCAKPTTAEEKAMFAKSTEKIKAVEVSKLFKDAENNDDAAERDFNDEKIYLYVRKSATAKKPASAVSDVIEIKGQADEPGDFTSVSGEYDFKKKVWSFSFSSGSGDIEYLIFDDLTTASSGDISDAKWVKLGSKSIVTKKSTTKISKSKKTTLKETSYLLIRIAGVKGDSLPSKSMITKITAKGTGSGSGAKLVWEAVQ